MKSKPRPTKRIAGAPKPAALSPNQTLLGRVVNHYLTSRDFNGLPAAEGMDVDVIADLIASGHLSLNRGDRHHNPHIRAFAAEPIEEQLAKLKRDGLAGCLYPEPKHLECVIDCSRYHDRPFTMKMALGTPELSFLPFDLSVLEGYRNDPRYVFEVDDVHGFIGVDDEYYQTTKMESRDQTLLEHFGFAYDSDFARAVAVYVRYLHRMTPEHQRIWEAHILSGDFAIHPDYYNSSIRGEFPEKAPIFVAFTEELRVIRDMSRAMGREPLFREDFREGRRPRDFAFLLRPTLRAFNDFALILDKMISDNIDAKFFRDDISLERDLPRADGKVVVERKGTIQALDEWLKRTVRFPDPKPVDDMIATFKRVRKLRQQPAHAVKDDQFDQKYFKEQRTLIIDAYTAIRCLRLILANHPATATVKIPSWLAEGKIRNF